VGGNGAPPLAKRTLSLFYLAHPLRVPVGLHRPAGLVQGAAPGGAAAAAAPGRERGGRGDGGGGAAAVRRRRGRRHYYVSLGAR